MRRYPRRGALALILALAPGVQSAQKKAGVERGEPVDHDVRLPGGKSQRDEILKEDHKHDMEDADALIEMAQELRRELEKNDRHVLSVASIRKTEEIEKLARRIRSRLRRY